VQTIARLNQIRLKKGKERPILQHHHWVYSGAVDATPEFSDGDLAEVFASNGKKLGIAMLAKGRSILGTMLAYGESSVEESLAQRIHSAVSMRNNLTPANTNAIRLINAEGDGIPGLIVDRYADILVVQISNPGIDQLKDTIVSLLIETCSPRSIYEKSTSSMRSKNGATAVKSLLFGEPITEVEILEKGLKFVVDIVEGQKTGLFLDQREMRNLVKDLSLNKSVLNCFAYTGAFSIAALSGGATHVDSVEISAKCELAVQKNLQANKLPESRHTFIKADVFDFLKTAAIDHDIVILDPPAFAKAKKDVDNAFKAYKDLNCQAIQKMAPGTLLLTCSCSYYIDEELFQNILFRAALEAGRRVRVIERQRHAHDHPISLFHPESSYLKSLLLYVD
jgi:23S rRNA (cytosine1962-C5)-methyltransferase